VATSTFLAKLIGPLAFAIGVALLLNHAAFRAMAEQFLASTPLMFLSGLLTMAAGLAIVLTHNIWTPDWRAVITILGWLMTLGGAYRLIAPQQVMGMGRKMMAHPLGLKLSTGFYLILGALLCFYGYLR
jgi:hypothetical protein